MSYSEQLTLFKQSLDDLCNGDFSAYADKFSEDFRRESFPRGKAPQANENSKADYLASMQKFRRGLCKPENFTMEVKECVEQPGGLMTFVHATLTTIWDEKFDTDMVILANFSTGEDGKLKISFLKQFLDGFYLMKMTESLKANGIPVPGA